MQVESHLSEATRFKPSPCVLGEPKEPPWASDGNFHLPATEPLWEDPATPGPELRIQLGQVFRQMPNTSWFSSFPSELLWLISLGP